MAGTDIPTFSGDLKKWANDLVRYLRAQTPVKSATEPRPVLLAHMVGDERASADGIMMYDPVAQKPVISINGVWTPMI